MLGGGAKPIQRLLRIGRRTRALQEARTEVELRVGVAQRGPPPIALQGARRILRPVLARRIQIAQLVECRGIARVGRLLEPSRRPLGVRRAQTGVER